MSDQFWIFFIWIHVIDFRHINFCSLFSRAMRFNHRNKPKKNPNTINGIKNSNRINTSGRSDWMKWGCRKVGARFIGIQFYLEFLSSNLVIKIFFAKIFFVCHKYTEKKSHTKNKYVRYFSVQFKFTPEISEPFFFLLHFEAMFTACQSLF